MKVGKYAKSFDSISHPHPQSLYWSYLQPDFDMLCEMTTPPTDTSYAATQVLNCAFGYLLLKMADYMDTIFFVLRKQKSHISFLHLYHHSLMGLVGYIGVRFAPGGNGAILVLANTLVHTVMYTYYLLSAMPSTRAFAGRFKKHITQLQLVICLWSPTYFKYSVHPLLVCVLQFQFMCIGLHYTQAYVNVNCPFPSILCVGLILQNSFMTAMFADFYVRTYWREPKRVEPVNGKGADGINEIAKPVASERKSNGNKVGSL